MRIRKIIFSILTLASGIFILALPGFVVAQATISINPNIPGVQNVSTAGPCGWIANFYTFALIIAGILAFGSIVWGGVLYATSAGNASKQGEGRSWIESALIGLFLLGVSYLVLQTVNPALIKCSLPQLSLVATTGGAGGSSIGIGTPAAPPVPASGNCASGPCQILPDCTPSAGNINGRGAINCNGAQAMVNLLNCVNQADPNFSVSEGYPPTVGHTDTGHNTGCAIDVHVSGSSDACSAVASMEKAISACSTGGLQGSPYNEYLGCVDSHNPPTRTGNNLHISVHGQGC